MDNISKPSITRLARRAGAKSIADNSYVEIRNVSQEILDETIKNILIVK